MPTPMKSPPRRARLRSRGCDHVVDHPSDAVDDLSAPSSERVSSDRTAYSRLPSMGMAPATMLVPPRSPRRRCSALRFGLLDADGVGRRSSGEEGRGSRGSGTSRGDARIDSAHGVRRSAVDLDDSTRDGGRRMHRQWPSGQRADRACRRRPAVESLDAGGRVTRGQRAESERGHGRTEDRHGRRTHRRSQMLGRRVVGDDRRAAAG